MDQEIVPIASVFIGFNEKIKNYIDLDIDRNNLLLCC
jgi:hypothetical protein